MGIDLVNVADFSKRIGRTKQLKTRLFTKHELDSNAKRPIEHLASRFAVKEAFKKAIGKSEIGWHDVETRNYDSGKPYLQINKGLLSEFNIIDAEVSISNTKEYAVAMVILRKE